MFKENYLISMAKTNRKHQIQVYTSLKKRALDPTP